MDISNTWDMEKKTLSFKKSICNKKEKKERRRVFEVTEKKGFPFLYHGD